MQGIDVATLAYLQHREIERICRAGHRVVFVGAFCLPRLQPSGDLDVLIPQGQLDRFVDTLLRMGYRRLDDFPEQTFRAGRYAKKQLGQAVIVEPIPVPWIPGWYKCVGPVELALAKWLFEPSIRVSRIRAAGRAGLKPERIMEAFHVFKPYKLHLLSNLVWACRQGLIPPDIIESLPPWCKIFARLPHLARNLLSALYFAMHVFNGEWRRHVVNTIKRRLWG